MSAAGPSRQRYEHEVEIEHLRAALLIMTCVALSLAVLYSVGVYERRDMICTTRVAPRQVER